MTGSKGGRPRNPETDAMLTLPRGVVWVVPSHGTVCPRNKQDACALKHRMDHSAANFGLEVHSWHTRDGRLCVVKPPK